LQQALSALAQGDIKQDLFDPELAARLATPRGQMSLPQYAPFTQIESFVYLQTEPSDPDRILRYRVHVQNKSFVVAFTITQENRIYTVGARAEGVTGVRN